MEAEQFGGIEMQGESLFGYDMCVVPSGHSGSICRNKVDEIIKRYVVKRLRADPGGACLFKV